MSLSSPLSNVRILDFSRILSAPFASMLLGDLGAEIWKIERPGSGDEIRSWAPSWTPSGQSCFYVSVNRNKKSIALNLKHPKGQQLVRYGPDGPYATRAAYDINVEAIGGFMDTTGPKEGQPCIAGSDVVAMMTGLYAHGAILAALLQRTTTGKGEKIDCNLLSTQ
uniref:CoA transferase n=1 Tax=Parascaris equorum TaxID=6256 RepID=A0A914RHY6_PAREQ